MKARSAQVHKCFVKPGYALIKSDFFERKKSAEWRDPELGFFSEDFVWENSVNIQAAQAARGVRNFAPISMGGLGREAGSDLEFQVTVRTGT